MLTTSYCVEFWLMLMRVENWVTALLGFLQSNRCECHVVISCIKMFTFMSTLCYEVILDFNLFQNS